MRVRHLFIFLFGLLAVQALPGLSDLSAERRNVHLPSYDFSSNQTEFFSDRDAFFDMLNLVKSARRSIRLDFYIFGGLVAEQITDHLIQKHYAGLDVRVMLDKRMGSVPQNWKETKPIVDRLKRAGVPFQFYTSQPFTPGGRPSVDHNKVIIVDEESAAVGSTNFAKLFWDYHDVSVRVTGPVARELARQFDYDWRVTRGELPMPYLNTVITTKPFAGEIPRDGTSQVRILSTGPGRSNVLHALRRAIDRAQSSIDIFLHEFDDPILEAAVLRAHQRGVKVRVLLDPWNAIQKFTGGIGVPENIPNLGAVKKLKAGGVDVRLYVVSEQLLTAHMKLMVVDRETLHIGSANWAFGSWEHIAETNLEIHGGRAVEQAQAMFDRDWAEKSRVSLSPTKGMMRLFHLYQWARGFIL